jgi:hypothetical protein
MIRIFLVASLALGAGLLSAQAPSPTRGQALELLGKAVQAQLPGSEKAGAEPIRLSSFQGDFRVRMYDYKDPKKPKETDGTLRQYWSQKTKPARGERPAKIETLYRRELSSDATKEVMVLASYEDDSAWRRTDGGKKKGPTVFLNRKETERDRKDLAAEKRRLSQLFRLFLLQQIPVKTLSARMGVREHKLDLRFGRKEISFVTDQILFADKNGNDYQLWLDRKSHHPVKARVRFAGSKSWETFTMAEHLPVEIGGTGKADAKGRRIFVPCNVVYHDAGNRPLLMLSTQKPAEAFRFNTLDKKRLNKLFPRFE